MNLGIDISQIVYEGTGVARFTRGLTDTILDLDRENKWTFFFSSLRRKLEPGLENKIRANGHKLIKWKLPPTLLAYLWNDLHFFSKIFTLQLSSFKDLDWFITSDWTEPALPSKKATIVHDLVFKRYPEIVDQTILLTQQKRLNWVKKESGLIFADSQATKSDLVKFLNIEPKKIQVNYPGVEVNKPSLEQINRTLKKYNLKSQFILSVGKQEPRKNIKRLIKAFQIINPKNLDLVIVGPKGWETMGDQSINRLNSLQDSIKYLNYVENDELYSLYSSCKFFVFPSLWEGFGYPIIEAMKLGAAVITSDTSSLKEIAADAAVLFNPNDEKDIHKSISKLIADVDLRKSLIKRGLERSKMFSWSNYYQKMIKTLYDNRS